MENIKSVNIDMGTQSQIYLVSLKIFVCAELPLVKAVAGCAYNSNFFTFVFAVWLPYRELLPGGQSY